MLAILLQSACVSREGVYEERSKGGTAGVGATSGVRSCLAARWGHFYSRCTSYAAIRS
jgi:hypothetical protein